MTEPIDTVAWIHLREGRVLGTRSRGKSLFYIPGGKRHPGESDLQTLLREVEEELTVTLAPESARHFGTYEAPADDADPTRRVRMACYTGEFTGTLRASAEIEELAWLDYSDRERTAPVDRLVFDDLKALGRLR
ncbi:NUDIX hydrolase [Streptomyces alkaliterrae]|uniref:NUDIX domain-containing protein n=1 Tax=Streptomyces alkaliterrae TaxID=2213162 RepID=A0A5P0YTT4_9ACTN|nr:NUDIX domain-containing protein [Streptomyces alkaliterrae]MBB1254883.1 NUDIX domain-containing protein [Streptomyces alkaliterrae]MBB1258860.1 NUDIX domain-containing protein [Streptomyces alkaliterrae]MQS03330.1 NUDIX domain-containing protein [Streptomyces alkaliterrae]